MTDSAQGTAVPFQPGVPLVVGDELVMQGLSRRVTGAIHLTEDGDTWSEYLLDGSSEQYLMVEGGESPSVVLWTQRRDLPPEPTGRSMVIQGQMYRRNERGNATYRTDGQTRTATPTGEVEYVDYEGPTGERLSYERFTGGQWEVSTGVVQLAQTIMVRRGGAG